VEVVFLTLFGAEGRKAQEGFTLVELLVASAVSLIVVLALGSLLTYQVASFLFFRRVAEVQRNVSESLDVITGVLRGAVAVASRAGPSFIDFQADPEGDGVVDRCSLRFDSQSRALVLTVSGVEKVRVGGVDNFSVTYFGYDSLLGQSSSSYAGGLPSGVRLGGIKVVVGYSVKGYGREISKSVEFDVGFRNVVSLF